MVQFHTPDDVVRDHLEPGERLLWSGQPVQGIRLRGYDALMIPLSLLWCGFAIFWEIMAVGMSLFAGGRADGPPWFVTIFFGLFGLPFVLIGLYLVFGRFWVESLQRARTFYGVTDNRIIIIMGLFSQAVKSLNLRTLSDLSMSRKSDGSGTITFGPVHPFAAFYGGASWPGWGWYSTPSFDRVHDVAEVYRIIRDAQKAT